jgi:hypothetical protein
MFESPLDAKLELIAFEGLGNVIKSPRLHCFER